MNFTKFAATGVLSIAATMVVASTANAAPSQGGPVVQSADVPVVHSDLPITAIASPIAGGATISQSGAIPADPEATGPSAAVPIALNPEQADFCRTAIVDGLIGTFAGALIGMVTGSGVGMLPGSVIGGLVGGAVPGPMPGPDTGSALAPEAPVGTPTLYRCGGIFGLFPH
ncbi:hypothetical protein ACFXO9_21085 [Nocardia tengchongensis]|uniref:hypothetical protein n=1 Tax=Nocardia tengchongensis TaxID=2055889 RepID=UPI0036BE4FD8